MDDNSVSEDLLTSLPVAHTYERGSKTTLKKTI
jgi:hypothetical protein